MTALRRLITRTGQAGRDCAASMGVFVQDVGHGLLEVSHNTLALVGLVAVAAILFVGGHSSLRHSIETETLGWLLARQDARTDPEELIAAELSEPSAVMRATASDPRELNRQQAAVAQWISRRYRVAPEPISRLVQEAWRVGDRVGLDPTLILSIIAIESSFNPFAQSSVGAQGLMQVMTRVHDDKYERFGGTLAAFDPVTNVRVGVQVLKECITRAGSLEAGLRHYVGAANLEGDGGYASRVLAEQVHLRTVAGGKMVAINAPLPPPQPTTVRLKTEPEAPALPKTDDKPAVEQVALLR